MDNIEKIQVGNSLFIRDYNQAGIFELIRKKGPISRKELAESSDFSAATISNHVRGLMAEGYVIETEKGHSTGGRKPVYLTVNPFKGYIISVVIEVNKFRIVLFNLAFKIEKMLEIPINNYDVEEVIDEIISYIKKILKELKIAPSKVLGIGIAVPGLVKKDNRVLGFAPNLEWEDVPIADLMEEEFSSLIIIENEANAAVIGEREFIYPDIDNLVYISINEGIGCGIIFGGRLYSGASGSAGEYGHIIVDSSGPECHCGKKGCWETMASENYIVDSARAFRNSCSKEEVYRLAREGREEFIGILEKTGYYIGVGLVNIINSLNPHYLVIGGNISTAERFIKEPMMEVVKKEALGISLEESKIRFSKLKDLAVVNGMGIVTYRNSLNLDEGGILCHIS